MFETVLKQNPALRLMSKRKSEPNTRPRVWASAGACPWYHPLAIRNLSPKLRLRARRGCGCIHLLGHYDFGRQVAKSQAFSSDSVVGIHFHVGSLLVTIKQMQITLHAEAQATLTLNVGPSLVVPPCIQPTPTTVTLRAREWNSSG